MEQFQKEHYKKIPQKSLEDFNKKVEAAKTKQQQETTQKQKPVTAKLEETINKPKPAE
jgi:hypothetical protein